MRNQPLAISFALRAPFARFVRRFATSTEILQHVENKIQVLGEKKTLQLKSLNPDTKVGSVHVKSVVGGMRGLIALLTDTSELCPLNGIKFRNKSIDQLIDLLPRLDAPNAPRTPLEIPSPEGLFYLLLTGEIPTQTELEAFADLIKSQQNVPQHVLNCIRTLPSTVHPMAKLAIGVNALQGDSEFTTNYDKGLLTKTNLWRATLRETISMCAKVPVLAAHIYNEAIKKKDPQEYPSDSPDMAQRLANALGLHAPHQVNFIRLYLILHADHEGGNVSAHAAHLVGSALADPFTALAAGLNGLAAPLHGLANQECLRWQQAALQKFGKTNPTSADIELMARETLAAGKVIPGYGHAVLRITDPRFTAQINYGNVLCPKDNLFCFLKKCVEVIPNVLGELGKVSNPFPNVDCAAGTLLTNIGLTEPEFYTVLFAVSRTMGIGAQLVWSRYLHLPIERPKSVTLDTLSLMGQDPQGAKR